MSKPKVSILCITYNHAKYIRDALDGFVMQKTTFPFEVLIHDDASTDGTADIIREYEKKYPDIIKPIYQTENKWSKGVKIAQDFLWPNIQGEYVAINEGDDYWTDENKLQKQVDFLESHPDYAVCFHPVQVIWEDNRMPAYIFPKLSIRFHKRTLTVQDLLRHNFIQTNSVMYRWHDITKEWPKCSFIPGDYMMHLFQAQYGKIGFLPHIMSVYRRNAGGVWTGAMEFDEWFLKYTIPHLYFYNEVQKKFNVDKTKDMILLIQKALIVFLRHKEFDKISQIIDEFPKEFNDALMGKSKNKYYKKYRFLTYILLGINLILLIQNVYLMLDR